MLDYKQPEGQKVQAPKGPRAILKLNVKKLINPPNSFEYKLYKHYKWIVQLLAIVPFVFRLVNSFIIQSNQLFNVSNFIISAYFIEISKNIWEIFKLVYTIILGTTCPGSFYTTDSLF